MDTEYLNSRILEFERTLREFCEQNKVAFAPIFEEFKKQLDRGKNLLADGLHPNNDGHELIFQLVRPELDKLLAS